MLVVDVGNSRLRAGRFKAGKLVEDWSCAYDQARPRWSAAWRHFLQRLHDRHGSMPTQVASVARRRAGVVCRALADLGYTPLHQVDHDDAWPFEIDIEEPHTVGIDRLANVAGAVSLGHRSALAIDLGTAVTIDILDSGVFRGGLIMPGMALQARALHEHTSHLPLIDVTKTTAVPGRNTHDAMLAGITQMTLAGISAVARRSAASLGRGTPILVTGGWAHRFLPILRSARSEPHLLFLGLYGRATRDA